MTETTNTVRERWQRMTFENKCMIGAALLTALCGVFAGGIQVGQWLSSKRANDIAESARRPQVSMTVEDMQSLPVGGDMSVKVTFKNAGPTPALKVSLRGMGFPAKDWSIRSGMDDKLARRLDANLTSEEFRDFNTMGYIAADDKYEMTVLINPNFSEKDITSLKSGRDRFFVQLQLNYSDEQNRPYETRGAFYPVWYEGKWMFLATPTWNDMK